MEDGKAEDPFDPVKLRIPPEMVKINQQAHKKAQKAPRLCKTEDAHFTKFPDSWAKRLRNASGRTWVVARYLLHQSWKTHGVPFRLANAGLASEGVSRTTKLCVLLDLERRGLIAVERHPRKSPIITVILAPVEHES